MPFENKPNLYDETCDECGNVGMKKTQAPSRNGVTTVFKCPECGSTKPEDQDVGGNFVSKL